MLTPIQAVLLRTSVVTKLSTSNGCCSRRLEFNPGLVHLFNFEVTIMEDKNSVTDRMEQLICKWEQKQDASDFPQLLCDDDRQYARGC